MQLLPWHGPGGSVNGAHVGATLQAGLAPAVWGSTYLVTTELLPPGRPMLDALLRALPAGLLLLAFTRTMPRGDWWWKALLLGTLNIGAFQVLLFAAADRLPGGVAATLIALQPLAVGVLAVPILGERLELRRILAGIAGALGVGLLVLRSDAALDPLGVLIALAAAGCMAVGVVLTGRWGRPGEAVNFAAWQLTAGGLVLVPAALALDGLPRTLSAGNIAGYVYLALPGAALTYPLWFRGIARLSAPLAAFLGLLSPVAATVLGWTVKHETFTPLQMLGFMVVVGSILAAQGGAGRRDRSGAARAWRRAVREAADPRASAAAALRRRARM